MAREELIALVERATKVFVRAAFDPYILASKEDLIARFRDDRTMPDHRIKNLVTCLGEYTGFLFID